MKDGTSAASLMLVNHQRAGWLSQVTFLIVMSWQTLKDLITYLLNVSISTVLQQIYSLILTALHKDSVAFTNHSNRIYLILRTVFSVVMVALLLMLLGFLHWRKIRVA